MLLLDCAAPLLAEIYLWLDIGGFYWLAASLVKILYSLSMRLLDPANRVLAVYFDFDVFLFLLPFFADSIEFCLEVCG